MLISPDLKIFGTVPEDKQQPGTRGPFAARIVVLESAPKVFMQATLLAVDVVSIVWAFLIVFTMQHSPVATIITIEVLFVASVILLTLARRSAHFSVVLAYYGITLVLSTLLNVLFPGSWGAFGLLTVCGFAMYRFPPRWSWPIAAVSIIALAQTHGLLNALLTRHLSADSSLVTPLALAAFLCWVGWSRRTQHLLVLELQEVQAQLRAQMARAEQLAATRERARIARDMHDVLAHSLTMLSIQVQAARQLLLQQPERVPAKLDDIAELLRESIAESRRVVGLLRETAIATAPQGEVGARLQTVIDRFSERTGIHCVFEEKGTLHPVSDAQAETLHYALQEALTNAHRHGAAQHIWAELRWHAAQVTLQVRDDGHGQGTAEQAEEAYNGHHGLQGMSERATALGGELQAGPQRDGGFAVTLSLLLVKARLEERK